MLDSKNTKINEIAFYSERTKSLVLKGRRGKELNSKLLLSAMIVT